MILKGEWKKNGAERDTFIAELINSSLKDSEIGLLFIGANHDVKSRLAEDIQTTFLDERLKEIAREIHPSSKEHFGGNPEQR